MPWGSWITCEETVNGPDVGPDFTGGPNVPLTKRHGFVFEVPKHGQSDREPITARRPVRARVGGVRPARGRAVPERGQLRVAVRVLPVRAEAQPAAHRPPGQPRPAADAEGQAPAQPGPGGQPAARAPGTGSSGWTSTTRRRRSRTRRASRRRPPTTPRSRTSRGRAGRRARRTSPGWRARSTTGASCTSRSTQGGGPAETVARPDRRRVRQRHGQVWAYHTRSRTLSLVYQSPGPDVLDFPDNVTTSPRGTLVVCEDNINDNYLRGLTQRGELFDIALNRLVSSTGRRRGSTTSSPAPRSRRTGTRCSSTSRPAPA